MSNSSQRISAFIDEIEKVIVGKREIIEMLVIALLAEGHVLIEDVPGVGKTTLAMALGKVGGMSFKRAQFTPDVMASDITGFTMYNKETNKFEYRSGLVMTNVLLADEINRTSPKTQSALLESMEEKRVTVDGIVHKLASPFMVIATQNEKGYVGTFPLPEAQLDRFMIKVTMGYPTVEQEIGIISDRQLSNPLDTVENVISREEISECISEVKNVNIEPSVYRYIVELVAATRTHRFVALGASPRASLALMQSSQAYAYIRGRSYVVPQDVLSMLANVVSHRIILTQDAKFKNVTPLAVLRDIVSLVKPPLKGE